MPRRTEAKTLASIPAVQKGKINLDAPAIRTALKSIAIVNAQQEINDGYKPLFDLIIKLSGIEYKKLLDKMYKPKKRAKAKRGKRG